MADLFVCKDADADLDAIYEKDEDAGALIEVLLQEIDENNALVEELCRPRRHYLHKPPFEVKRYEEMWALGKNIFILKIHSEDGELLPYRVLYGFNAQRNSYHVLAAVDREIAYDNSDPLFNTILARYEQCGIPTYG